MTNATAFWGKDAVNCNGQTGAAATPGTCNGDGNKVYTGTEGYRAWDHLALAGLWPGQWPGIASIAAGQSVAGNNPGVNLPASKYQHTYGSNTLLAYMFRTYNAGSNDRWNSNESGTGLFISSALNTCCGAPFLDGGGLIGPDAWNVDTKIDDGSPSTGKLQVKFGYAGNCATTNVIATAQYRKDDTSNCPLYYDVGIQ